VFSKKDFQNWGKQNAVLFAAVMTRIEGRKDDDLLRTYGFRGFPSMALLDAEGEAITKSIPRDLYSMRKIVAAAPTYAKLAAMIEAGETVDETKWFFARLGMGKLELEEAKAFLDGGKLSGKALADAEQGVFVLEMGALQSRMRQRGLSPEEREAITAEVRDAVYAAFQAGKRLPEGVSVAPFVDDMLITAAKENGDAKAFFHSYERVKAGLVDRMKSLASYPERMRADLEKYKDDPQRVERIQQSMKRFEQFMSNLEEQVAELDEMAKKLKQG